MMQGRHWLPAWEDTVGQHDPTEQVEHRSVPFAKAAFGLQRSDSKAILQASCGNTASMQLPCTCQSSWGCACSILFIQAF